MASGFRASNGQDFDDLFDPDVVGDGPSADGMRKSDGTTLRYAHIQYGTARPSLGFRLSNGADVTTLWATKGSAVYALPINNASYYANNQSRGVARIRFVLAADGTYQVQRTTGANDTNTVIASGTWLPAGDSAGNWTVAYEAVENGSTHQGDGTGSGVNNQAPSATGIGSSPYCEGFCQATLTGGNADSHGYLRIRLYRAGALRSTTTISYTCNVNGN